MGYRIVVLLSADQAAGRAKIRRLRIETQANSDDVVIVDLDQWPTIRIVHGLISKSVCNVLQKWETRMFVQKMLITAALLQLMIVPGMTQVIKPDSAHRYQGGPKTEEHVMKNSRASMENNFVGNNAPPYYAPQYNAHQYHGGPKGH